MNGLLLALDAANPRSYPGTGTTWSDLSHGGENNGTLTNGPTFSSSNLGEINFDGVNDTVNVTLDLRRNFTLSCWIKYNVINGFAFFGQGPTTTNQGLHIWNTSNTTVRFGMFSNDTDFTSLSLSTNTWYNFVFTYNHSSPFTKQMYLNGTLMSGTQIQSQSQYSGTGVLRIGATYSSGGSYANGTFTNVKIYNRILTNSEVSQNYNTIKGRYGL
jgi:hypothetical protein